MTKAIKTGSGRIVCNVWSDAARAAAIASRQAKAKGKPQPQGKGGAKTGSRKIEANKPALGADDHLEHAGAAEAKADALEKRHGGKATPDSKRWRAAAEAHRTAAKVKGGKGEGGEPHGKGHIAKSVAKEAAIGLAGSLLAEYAKAKSSGGE